MTKAARIRVKMHQLRQLAGEMESIRMSIRANLNGATITINDPHYNGQPHGFSRNPLKGKSWVAEDDSRLSVDGDGFVVVAPPGQRLYLFLSACLVDGESMEVA